MTPAAPTEANQRVLSTLNRDGTRRWLHPRVSKGRFLWWRRVTAYALIVVFTALPWIKINGVQSILLNIPKREFTFFGATFLPTDTLLLALFLGAVFVTVFLITALFGRLWCGWGCPQTVYMEFVYRPLERLFDGSPDARRRGKPGAAGVRKVLKYAAFLLVSLYLAHTFLGYFVPVEELFRWIRQSPVEHPTAFVVMAATTGLMMFDFSFFREQTCIVACPYGRFQSVLLDRSSLIIGYDAKRGEPRGPIRSKEAGDCIDCSLCVVTCPTGIDIRDGLQMECIGCAQCIDACDSVMKKIGRAPGLIRYSSQEAMATGRRKLFRPRVVLYPLLLVVILGLFGAVVAARATADVTLLRAGAVPYRTLDSGEVANDVRVKIVNRSDRQQAYHVGVSGIEGARVHADDPLLRLDAAETAVAVVSIMVPAQSFNRGRATVTIQVRDDDEFSRDLRYRLQGPFGKTEDPPQ
jgi:cytochrome c oxidase accessory protein FixG